MIEVILLERRAKIRFSLGLFQNFKRETFSREKIVMVYARGRDSDFTATVSLTRANFEF